MTLLEIFEKVNLVTPLEQRRFFNYFDDSVTELEATFGDFIYEKEGEYTPPKDLSDSVYVLPLYHYAIVDNIIFLANHEESYKGEFIRKSRQAYLTYWRENAKGKRIKRGRW